MVKPSPASALEMSEADLLFQLEIVSLNGPSKFCGANKMNVTLGANAESQNFVGASSSGGHSINNNSSRTVSLPASLSCAERTLTRAKREERTSFVPSRQRIVFQLPFGSAPWPVILGNGRHFDDSAATRS